MSYPDPLAIETTSKTFEFAQKYIDSSGSERVDTNAATIKVPHVLKLKHEVLKGVEPGARHLVSLSRAVRCADGKNRNLVINITLTAPDHDEFNPELVREELELALNFFRPQDGEEVASVVPFKVSSIVVARLLRGES